MKRFRFTLEAVSVLRDQQKKLSQEKYAAALAKHVHAAEDLARLDRRIELADSTWRSRVGQGAIFAADALQNQQHQRSLQEARVHRVQVLKRADEELQRAMEAMQQAHQACEAVSKLRDRQHSRHLADRDREERRVLDELAARGVGLDVPGMERSLTHD